MWFHPWGSLAAVLGMIGVLAAMAFTPDLASQFYASLIPIAVIGVAFVALRRGRPGVA
jgi:L-asparagine transporter-like permease